MNFSIKPHVSITLMNDITRQVIKLSNSFLYPERSVSDFPVSDKPPNCKTVLVGGLPELITEQLIKEIFEICGQLEAISLPGNGYCYITFCDSLSVDKAIFFTGYRLNIHDKNEAPYTGVLFVNYAGAEVPNNLDDHRSQIEQASEVLIENEVPESYLQDDSITHLAKFCICENLSSEETFSQTVDVLKEHLKEDEYAGNNPASFITVMQCIYKHLLKLQNAKKECEEIYKRKESEYTENMEKFMRSLMTSEKVTGLFEQCSNDLTAEEKDNFEQWKTYAEEMKSDVKKKIFKCNEAVEVDKRNDEVFNQMPDDMEKQNDLQCGSKELHNFSQIAKSNSQNGNCSSHPTNTENDNFVQSEAVVSSSENTGNDAIIISLACIFLEANPGEDIRSIQSYLCKYGYTIDSTVIENIMRRYPSVFEETVTGVGCNLQKKWYYIASPV